MSPRYGIRKIEPIDGGHIAWLYPGGADLDDVLLALAAVQAAEDLVEWTVTTWEGNAIEDDRPTYLAATYGDRHPEVGYYRRLPWCTCGEEHTWHYEPSAPGPGAMLAVIAGGAW